MKRVQLMALLLAAGAIFAFVAYGSRTQAAGNIEETIREVQNNENFQESGGTPAPTEYRREAGEWQTESSELMREANEGYNEFLLPPDELGQPEEELESEQAVSSLEELIEGPLGERHFGGGGSCNYGDGWCPPSCMSCSPQAY